MSDLPGDIIADILTRLPVKSLLRFRCVSNPWRNLISSRNFAKLHLKRTSEHHANIDHHTLLISTESQVLSMNYNESESYNYNHLKFGFPILGRNRDIRVFGTCNGLIFLNVGFYNRILWNPSTRDYKVLPKPECFHGSFAFGGIGFDASIDDYKAVIGSFSGAANTLRIEVYTLKTDSWKRIQDIGNRRVLSQTVTLVNGALHWLQGRCGDGGEEDANAIMSFDLVQEQFQKPLSLPNIGRNNINIMSFKFGVSQQGCLCLSIPDDEMNVQVWVMKEYGVNSSWSMLFSVSFETTFSDRYFFRPLCILKNGGDVLVNLDGSKLMRYSLKDNTFRLIRDGRERLEAIVYEESLVSLNSFCD